MAVALLALAAVAVVAAVAVMMTDAAAGSHSSQYALLPLLRRQSQLQPAAVRQQQQI
jgi:hypothetical protein